MALDGLSQSELDSLQEAIDGIIQSNVTFEKSSSIPLESDLSDSNTVKSIKASMLFVDMRSSSTLPERFSDSDLVKIYRTYSRAVVQAIRRCGGVVRDFMGDGILAVFIDSDGGSSEEKAVRAARYIATAIDFVVNPKLDASIGCRVSCGIGVNTGKVHITKVGMRGREADPHSEAETGLDWIGNCTNLACKFSSCVDCEAILVSDSTYRALTPDEKKLFIQYEGKRNGLEIKGWLAKSCYLETPISDGPCVAPSRQSLPADESSVLLNYFDAFAAREREFGRIEREGELKLENLKAREASLNAREVALQEMQTRLKNERYEFFTEVLHGAFCEKAYVNAMGRRFWEELFESAVEAGKAIGKSRTVVKSESAHVMASIYESLEDYDRAYEFLTLQAEYGSWISPDDVKTVAEHVEDTWDLKYVLQQRLLKKDFRPDDAGDFVAAHKCLEDSAAGSD